MLFRSDLSYAVCNREQQPTPTRQQIVARKNTKNRQTRRVRGLVTPSNARLEIQKPPIAYLDNLRAPDLIRCRHGSIDARNDGMQNTVTHVEECRLTELEWREGGRSQAMRAMLKQGTL